MARIDPAYLLAGPESGKRAAFVAELKASLAKADGAPPEEHRLYANDSPVGDLLSLLRNGSLFASRKLVEYRQAELVKGKEQVEALAAYLRAPAEDSVLLLVTDSFYLEKGLEDAVGKERKRTFYELFENEKPRWIERRLGDFGIRIEEEAVEAILELVENDTQALESVCARLGSVYPSGTYLTETEIEAAVARNRQEDAFSLFARIAEGEESWALETLDAVLSDRQGGAVQILSALVWSFRRLLRVHRLMDSGESLEGACVKSGIKAKALQALHREATRRYSEADCERIIAFSADFDARLRASGSAMERALLQVYLHGVMRRKGELDLAGLAAF